MQGSFAVLVMLALLAVAGCATPPEPTLEASRGPPASSVVVIDGPTRINVAFPSGRGVWEIQVRTEGWAGFSVPIAEGNNTGDEGASMGIWLDPSEGTAPEGCAVLAQRMFDLFVYAAAPSAYNESALVVPPGNHTVRLWNGIRDGPVYVLVSETSSNSYEEVDATAVDSGWSHELVSSFREPPGARHVDVDAADAIVAFAYSAATQKPQTQTWNATLEAATARTLCLWAALGPDSDLPHPLGDGGSAAYVLATREPLGLDFVFQPSAETVPALLGDARHSGAVLALRRGA